MNDMRKYLRYMKTVSAVVRYTKTWSDVFLLFANRKDIADIRFRSGVTITKVKRECFGYPFTIAEIGRASYHHRMRDECGTIILDNTLIIPKSRLYVLPEFCSFFDNGGSIILNDNENPIVEFKYLGKKLHFTLPDVINGIHEIVEVFLKQGYDKFDFRDKTVLDIGGFIGDTAIFFACEGARKVISFEPIPTIYEIAKKNILTNKFHDVVQIYNEGVSDKSATSPFWVSERTESSSLFSTKLTKDLTTKTTGREEITIKTVSICEAFSGFHSIDILKMDCEGSEYAILEAILNNNLQQRIMDGIMLEAHPVNEKWRPQYAAELLKKMRFDVHINSTPYVWFIWCEKRRRRFWEGLTQLIYGSDAT